MKFRLTSLFITAVLIFGCSGLKLGSSGTGDVSSSSVNRDFLNPDSLSFEYDYNFLQTLYMDAKTAILLGDTALASKKYEDALTFIAAKNGGDVFPVKFENLQKKIDTEYSALLSKDPQYGENIPAYFVKEVEFPDSVLTDENFGEESVYTLATGDLVIEEDILEENKVVSVKFDNDSYGDQRDWLYQTFELANKYKFKPIVVSKFYKVFKESFKQYDIFYGLDEYEKVKDMSYSSYVIKRNDIQSATADSWEAGGVFINNSVFLKTWHHRQDWVGMNHKQVFKDIMCYE